MQKINHNSFRCRFYAHLTELHKTKEKQPCPKKCAEEEMKDDTEEEPSPEEKKIIAKNHKAVKQFTRCKCDSFKGEWKDLLEAAAEVLRAEKKLPIRQVLEQDEENKKQLGICVNPCKEDEDLEEYEDFLAKVKQDPCKKERKSKCEGENDDDKKEEKVKKNAQANLKSRESVKAKEIAKPAEVVKSPDPIKPKVSQKSSKQSQMINGRPKRCPPKKTTKRPPPKKKEEESFCSPAKVAQNLKKQQVKTKPSIQRNTVEKALPEEEQQPIDESSDEGDPWDYDNCRCAKKIKDDEDTSDDEKSSKAKGQPCQSCKPCQMPSKPCQPLETMATRAKCKWPATCRKLYEITRAEEQEPWIVKPKKQKYKRDKRQNIETYGECFNVAKLIPDYCVYQPHCGRQFYEIKDMTDCIAKDKKGCNREVPDVLKSLRPRVWLELVAIHRCSLGTLEIQFFAEACPLLVKKFVDTAEAGMGCRFRFTRVREDVWIEGKLDSFDCDDAGLIGNPCCPAYPNNCNIVDFEEGDGILSVSSRYYSAIDCCETIPFTITLCPMRILKGQRIGLAKVCNGSGILNTLKSLSTKYGCFKYDIGVRDCGVTYPKDKDKAKSKNKKQTSTKCGDDSSN